MNCVLIQFDSFCYFYWKNICLNTCLRDIDITILILSFEIKNQLLIAGFVFANEMKIQW